MGYLTKLVTIFTSYSSILTITHLHSSAETFSFFFFSFFDEVMFNGFTSLQSFLLLSLYLTMYSGCGELVLKITSAVEKKKKLKFVPLKV